MPTNVSPVTSVVFNAGGDQTAQFAIVVKEVARDVQGYLEKADLLAADSNGVWQYKFSVPRRDPADYGPEGGGETWHF